MMNIENQGSIFKQILEPKMNILNVTNAVNVIEES